MWKQRQYKDTLQLSSSYFFKIFGKNKFPEEKQMIRQDIIRLF